MKSFILKEARLSLLPYKLRAAFQEASLPSAQALNKPLLSSFADVPLVKASHMAKPSVSVRGDHTRAWIQGI